MKRSALDSIRGFADRLTNRSGDEPVRKATAAYWNVAGAFHHSNIVLGLHDLLRLYNLGGEVLYQSHDCIQGMKWNAGRIITGLHPGQTGLFTKEQAVEVVKEYNDRGIGVWLTFNNHLVSEEHLDDPRCNFLLDGVAHDPRNGVICASDLLLEYLRGRHPQMRVKLSVIRSYVEEIWRRSEAEILDWYARMFDRYDHIGLNPNLNKSYRLIEKLPLDRLEVMVSLMCEYRCEMAHRHYDTTARANLDAVTDPDLFEKDIGFCPRIDARDAKPTDRTVQISNETVNRLRSLGVRHFKIHGKTDNFWNLSRHVNYYILNPHGVYADWQLQAGHLIMTRWEVGRREFDG